MKPGDLVRYIHYPDVGGIVIQLHAGDDIGVNTIDILTHSGLVLEHRNPEAFEVVNKGKI